MGMLRKPCCAGKGLGWRTYPFYPCRTLALHASKYKHHSHHITPMTEDMERFEHTFVTHERLIRVGCGRAPPNSICSPLSHMQAWARYRRLQVSATMKNFLPLITSFALFCPYIRSVHFVFSCPKHQATTILLY